MIATLLGGVLLFVWGVASNMALAWHERSYSKLKDERTVLEALDAVDNGPGMYLIPNVNPSENQVQSAEEEMLAMEIATKQMAEGPMAWIVYRPDGNRTFQSAITVQSFLCLGTSALLSLLAVLVGRSFIRRFVAIVLSVLAGTLFAKLPLWIWWGFTDDWMFAQLLDPVVGGAIAGVGIACFTGPKSSE